MNTIEKRFYRYRLVDVFTENALEGNGLAVFLDASGLDDLTMQKIAREMNLSETTFILPSTRAACVARVRIFTPYQEMVFAGHPTVGTSFVLLDEGLVPAGTERFALDEKVGPVPIRVVHGDRPMIWLTTPSISEGPTYDRGLCAGVLGLQTADLLEIPPQLLSAGNPNVYVAVRSKDAVDRASTELAQCRKLANAGQASCVFVFAPTSEGAYSRMFAPEHGVMEDPATGSATGPLAAYMMKHGLVSNAHGTQFVSEQGAKMGRRSFLHVRINGENGANEIEVGGYVTPVAEGTLGLPY
jgi:trans-2,3-dihydro-3-hydroxyanthranilate isomerase